jgi:hypothetical protein
MELKAFRILNGRDTTSRIYFEGKEDNAENVSFVQIKL